MFDASLSTSLDPANTLTKEQVTELFSFFQQHPLFRWQDKQNNCEDRAHAITILLNHWGIPAYKGWVFGGAYLKKTTGNLMNLWNYHVAPALPVMEYSAVTLYVIDPATTDKAVTLYSWADAVATTWHDRAAITFFARLLLRMITGTQPISKTGSGRCRASPALTA